jgi:hypothetical protein
MTTAPLRSKWTLPAFSLFLGGCVLLAYWLGGNAKEGLIGLGIMVGMAGLLLLGGRSETIRMARGDGRDERWALIDLRATAIAGNVLIGIVIGMFMYEIANGRDGNPYGLLGAIAGLVYLVAAGVMRVRR